MGKTNSHIADPRSGGARQLDGWIVFNRKKKTVKYVEAVGGYTYIPDAGVLLHDPSGKVPGAKRGSWDKPMFWMLLGIFIMKFLELLARAAL